MWPSVILAEESGVLRTVEDQADDRRRGPDELVPGIPQERHVLPLLRHPGALRWAVVGCRFIK